MNSERTAAVVVTYNRKDLLDECIHSLLKQTVKDLDVLIIDNNSTDGTKEVVTSYNDTRIKYFNTGENLGGAGGFQYGMKKAMAGDYDYLWLMDDDSIPTQTALSELLKAGKQVGNFGFLVSKILWKDSSMCNMNIPKVSLNRKLANFEGKPKRIVMGTFVSFLVPTDVVKKVGLPIKEFFIWADDLEYSRRISRQYPTYFVPRSVVVHKCKSNNGSNIVTDTPHRFNRYRYAYRNEVYLYRREGIAGWLHLAFKTGLHTAKVLFKSTDHKRERLNIIWQSTKKGLSFNPAIEYVNKQK